jgi:hypothetical protein
MAALRWGRARFRRFPQVHCSDERWTPANALRQGALLLLALAWAFLPICIRAQSLDPRPEPEQTAGARSSPLPGTLRKQAAHRFLAQRGVGAASRSSARPASASLRAARNTQPHADLSQVGPSGTWQPLGPAQVSTAAYGLVTGRITSLAADLGDSSGNTLYLGATGGGVWKSTNAAGAPGSSTFTPLTDELATFTSDPAKQGGATTSSISIGALTVQPGTSGGGAVLLAGTGDINEALDSYYGVGILRSTNGGSNWSLIGGSSDGFHGGYQNYSFTGSGFAGFAWSTANPGFVVAAVAQSAEGMLVNAQSDQYSEAGIYYSSDAGQTWYLAIIEDQSGQIVQSPSQAALPPGNSVTSLLWNPTRQRFYAAVRFHGYYESLDGITWTRLVNQPGANLTTGNCPTNPGSVGQASCPIFRGVLAVQPVTGDMFALTTDDNNLDQGLFRDVCSTTGLHVSSCASPTVTFGTQIASGALEAGGGDTTIPSADYDLTLSAVAYDQDTILFAGTEDMYRCSLANSCAWRNTTNIETCAAAMVAPSQHATEGTFGSNGLIYFANDGGLWRTTDTVAQTGSVCAATDASHYQNLNSGIGSLAEIEHFSVSSANAKILLAGMGEFGTISTSTDSGPWLQVLTGEGSYTAIDPLNPQNWYTDAGGGVSIFRCTIGDSCSGVVDFGNQPVIGSTQVEDDADYFLDPAPWLLDPLDTSNILVGTCRIWRGPATGGNGWSSANLLSPILDGNNQEAFCDGDAQLRSLAAGLTVSSGTEQLYAGMAGPNDGGGVVPGHVYTSSVSQSTGVTTWTDISNSPVSNSSNQSQFNPGGFAISSLAVDPHDPSGQTVYVTTQGFAGNSISTGLLYGSIDGGAHWLNLSSNLPDAPANSVLVDPNVASTVYIALDTGVYSTTSIAACADTTQNCWTVYGSSLPNAPVTSLQIGSAGNVANLLASTYGRGIWELGLASSYGQAALAPASYTFANQQVATTSAPTTFTLSNTGSIPLTITQVAISSEYGMTNTCGSRLAATASCTIQVTFGPNLLGSQPGTLTVYTNVASGQLQSTLGGVGLAAGVLSVTPTALNFSATVLGATSAPLSVTVQNIGGVAVQLQPETATGDFAISTNTCGTVSLGPSATCTLGITFSPTALSNRTGVLSIPSNLPGPPVAVPLSGMGVSPAALTLTPPALSFPSVAPGQTTSPETITITSTGGVSAQLGSPVISGDYRITGNSCAAALTPYASCAIAIDFAPTAAGSRNGLLTLTAPNISGGQVTVPLAGTGVGASSSLALSPSSISFGSVVDGQSSPPLVTTLSNSGSVAFQLGAPILSAGFTIASTTCGASLAAGGSCVYNVSFSPAGAGAVSGLLTVQTSIAGSYVTASLSGTGVAPGSLSFSPGSLVFPATATAAVSAAQSLTLTNTGGSNLTLQALSISSNYSVASSTCGSTLAASNSCIVNIVFEPSTTGTLSGSITATAPGSTQQGHATLIGTAVTPVNLVFAPGVLSFGSIQQGKTSASQNGTLTNTGGLAAQLQPPVVTGDYAITSGSCGSTLAAAGSCTMAVSFTPTATGSRPGSVIVHTPSSTATLALSGTGTAIPVLILTPTTLTFGATSQGSSSPAQNVAISNLGSSTIQLQTIAITAGASDFALSANTCGATLAYDSGCTVAVTFTPTAGGQRTGLMTVSDATETHTVTLNGTGLTLATDTLAPASLTFDAQVVGTVSSTKSVTLTNSGGATLTSISTKVSGPFQATNNCGIQLGGGLSCGIAVSYTPTAGGVQTGQLTVTDAQRTQMVQLDGMGTLPASAIATPSSLKFGDSIVGLATASQLVTVTNNGGFALTNFIASSTGDFAINSNTGGPNICGSTVAVGATCTVGVIFTPQQAGNRSGQLTFSSSALNSPLSVSMAGFGEDNIQLSVSGSSTQVVTPGQTANYRLVVTSVGASAGPLSFTCSGAPANAACSVNPSTLNVVGGSTGYVPVSIATGAATAAFSWKAGAAMALLLPFLSLRRRASRPFLLLCAAAALVLIPTACGVHASSGSSGSTAGGSGGSTASGTYPITITGTFGGAEYTQTLTLTVQ